MLKYYPQLSYLYLFWIALLVPSLPRSLLETYDFFRFSLTWRFGQNQNYNFIIIASISKIVLLILHNFHSKWSQESAIIFISHVELCIDYWEKFAELNELFSVLSSENKATNQRKNLYLSEKINICTNLAAWTQFCEQAPHSCHFVQPPSTKRESYDSFGQYDFCVDS